MALTPAQSAYLADLLTGIGTGLMSAPRNGPPLAGFSMGVQNANQLMAARRQQQDQDQERQFRAQQLARQQKLDAETDAAKAAQARALSQLLPTTANQAGMRMTGAGPGASNSVPAAPTLAGMTDQQMAVLRALPPDQALSMIGTQAFKAPNLDAPTTKDFNEGGNIVTKQWDPTSKSWVALSTAPRWQPVQPPQMPADVVAWQMDRKADPTNPNFKTIADWRKYQQANNGQQKIITLHSPTGEAKSFYENAAEIPGMLQNGWTLEAPTAKAGPVITGEEAAKVNLDPSRKWQQNANGSYDEIVPKAIQPSYITLVGPDGTATTMDKADPNVSKLLKEGYVERSGADPNSKPFTEDQSKTAQLLNEILPDAKIAAENFDALTKLKDQFAGMAPDKVQSFFTAEPYQRAVNALSHVIANNLYSLSGAAITEQEASRRARLLLPAPGDGPQTIADKKARIGGFLGGMKIRAGKAGANLALPDLGGQSAPDGSAPQTGQAVPTGATPPPSPSAVPADLPQGSTYFGQSPRGNPVYKLPDGTTVEETP